jgi:ABC-2 type transport system permease protein
MNETTEGTENPVMRKGIADDIRQIGVVTKYELLKHLRGKKFIIFAAIAALVLVLITALNIIFDGALPDEPQAFMEQYLSFVYILLIIGVSLLCASTITSEFEERTALLMFPRPIKKISFFLGKVLACYIVVGGVLLIYYGICIIMSFGAAGGLDMNTFGSLGIALLFMIGAGGFALLMSSIFKKSSSAIIVTIMVMLLVFSIIDSVLIFNSVEPVFSVTYASNDIINFIAGDPTGLRSVYLPDMGIHIPGFETMTMANPTHGLAAAICVIWAAVTTTISAVLFKRREF